MSSLVRAVRRQRGLTLEEVAAQAGLTKSYLSKIEREQSNPSIAVALKIAKALGVDVGQLFATDGASRSLVIDRAADDTGGPGYRTLATAMLGKSMTPFVLRPHDDTEDYVHAEHPGQEFVYVLTGEAELHHGEQVTVLAAGDSAYFDAAVPHRIRRRAAAETSVLVVAHHEPGGRGQ
ncbi:helix-turn-helix transcriptional regulator [Nocardia farcinica]|uniref:helix-turn-helix domain-containing protein n=1 Tax=Nocardia farcinica TaxID=37329 RepID=UPI001893F1E5|nr:XRE family transcriptional regulator [Nocardia farcinica]MBF6500094.1 helix-turn-helix transcriptional regulator [Nocardia farcinica]